MLRNVTSKLFEGVKSFRTAKARHQQNNERPDENSIQISKYTKIHKWTIKGY